MKDLLERVAGCMPEGWALRYEGESYRYGATWRLRHEVDDEIYIIYLKHGDRAFAPLTALLKQEMATKFYGGLSTDIYDYGDRWGWDCCRRDDIEDDAWPKLSHGSTEFEAVAYAWLATRPLQTGGGE